MLPLDLLSLPMMLILLAIMPMGYAIAVLCLVLLPILGQIQREDTLKLRLPGLIRLALMTLCFALSNSYFFPGYTCHLSSQLLWLGWFIVEHIVHHVYRLLFGFRIVGIDTDGCCCSQLRQRALMTAYIRFDKTLLWFTGIVLAIALPLVYFAQRSDILDKTLSVGIALAALGVIIVELIHLNWLKRQLLGEYWVPIIGANDQVLGRVPSTDVRTRHGRLPQVRLVAYSSGMIYLERGAGILDKETFYDTPFREWQQEGEQLVDTAQRMIDKRFCGIRRAHPRLLLRYHHEEDGQDLLVYLFAVEIESPDLLLVDCLPIEGKWWCLQQLTPQIRHSDFSPYLCAELPLLEQTVLLAQRLAERSKEADTKERNQ